MSTSLEQPRQERPRFHDTAMASGLLDEVQLRAAEVATGSVLDRTIAPPLEWDQAVADRLVQDKLLTPFQAREILVGRRRFRLGQYTVLDEVARGGMGQVFRAEHAMMGREVAIKVLPRAKATPESEAAFRREMRMLGRLDHPNLVRAFDAGYDAMVYYLVTELVPGMDLKRHVQKEGPLDEASAASFIAQAARGLGHAHEQGLVHRDVKPGNLLVMPDGRLKVLDLGLAGSELEEESARLGRVVGTMDYIAPEQIRTPDDVGPSADIYALGCTLYYTVSGHVPFPGGTRREKMQRHLYEVPPSIREHVPGLNPEFCRVIEAMMVKDPAERLRSAADVVERLRPWTPDVPSMMPRRDGAADRPGRGHPPALPDAASPSGRRVAVRDDQDTPSLGRRWDGDAPGGVPEQGAANTFIRSIGPQLAVLAEWPPFKRAVRALPQAAILAAVGGAMFGGSMAVAREINRERFMDLMGGFGPFPLGSAAFVVLLLAQLLAAQVGRPHPRR